MRRTILWLAAVFAVGGACWWLLREERAPGGSSVILSSPADRTSADVGAPAPKEAASPPRPITPQLFPIEEERIPRPDPGSIPLRRSLIKIDEVKETYDIGVQFFDARGKDAFDAGHVQGAVLIDPTDEAVIGATTKPAFLAAFDPRFPVIVYDDGGDCDASQLIGTRLRQFGFTNVKIFEEGFPVWKAKGYAIEPRVIR